MIVLDASAAVDLLLAVEPHASNLWTIIAEHGSRLAAPHLIDAEIGQVMRRLVLTRAIPRTRALGVLEDLTGLPLQRFAHGGLLERAFALHQNLTIYDALYVVLAEVLRVPLVTRDKALAQVPGHRAKVIVL